YLYRDWVIRALNDDMPYDLFVKAQLAADLLDEKSRWKMLPALGFLGQGPWFYDNGAVEITRADERHDRVDVVSRGFLGLTVGCARCHDHKYDPIPAKDYYGLAGVFLNTVYHEYPQVPQSVSAEFKRREKEIEARQKLVGEFMSTESTQLAETLAEEFQNSLVDIMFERNEIKEENEIIEAKALPGTKKKKHANLPNEFVTNDDFCPGCGLELQTLALEKMNLWTDVFQRDLSTGEDPMQAPERQKPGLLVFRGWGLERQLSA